MDFGLGDLYYLRYWTDSTEESHTTQTKQTMTQINKSITNNLFKYHINKNSQFLAPRTSLSKETRARGARNCGETSSSSVDYCKYTSHAQLYFSYSKSTQTKATKQMQQKTQTWTFEIS